MKHNHFIHLLIFPESNIGPPRAEGLFARKRRTSSGDKGICYGDSEHLKTEKPPSIHTLDPDPLTIKSGSPIPKKLPQIFDIEPAGKILYPRMRFGFTFLNFSYIYTKRFIIFHIVL